MNKLLVNASNIHGGGGLQVATSIISEICKLNEISTSIVVWASSEVHANLRNMGCDPTTLPSYEVQNSYGLKLLLSPLAFKIQEFNAVATIFGPLYVWSLRGLNIMGFAQAWILYGDNDAYRLLSIWSSIKIKLKYFVQSIFFRRADRLVVELEHVRRGLLNKNMGTQSTIDVVRNCLSSIYTNPSIWQRLDVPYSDVSIKLGFVGRNYVHKNTHIFPEVVHALQRLHGISACIYVTFTDEEWHLCDDVFRASVINVGPLFVAQCPTFYSHMDAVIFPSLLECFSATPLEAMAMKKPLFASDRPFNRDVCHEHAHYFDPLSPESAANAIARVFKHGGPNPEALKAAREHALNFSNPKERAEKYLAILMQCLQDKNNSKTINLPED